ncbi:MAG: hypothetical protein D6800_01730 [Candidatus Zixiibacteriota bacterium]|nr:MAG: hypothetical protein D6800_01730 [candidate division Zixibacteria bacterium]
MNSDGSWTQRVWPYTGITVGLCAWRVTMLAGCDRSYVQAHPSLIVSLPDDDDSTLKQAEPHIGSLPVLVVIEEPPFARQLESIVMARLGSLNRERIDALVLKLHDTAEIKSGGMVQTLYALRDRGVVGCLGLAHDEANAVEWLSQNSAVRILGMNYSLKNQAVGYRALNSAQSHGMAALSLAVPDNEQSIRFALGETDRVLPVLDRPIPPGLTPMSTDELARQFASYQRQHPEPPALKRGLPPMSEY